VSPFAIVVEDTFRDHGLKFAPEFGVEEEREVLFFEAPVEALAKDVEDYCGMD